MNKNIKFLSIDFYNSVIKSKILNWLKMIKENYNLLKQQQRSGLEYWIIDYVKKYLAYENISEMILSIVFSVVIILVIIFNSSFTLNSFPDRIIGTATLFGVDISSRIKLYAKLLVLFPVFLLIIFHSLLLFKYLSFKYKSSESYKLFSTLGYFIFFYLLCYGFIGNIELQHMDYFYALMLYSIIFSFISRFIFRSINHRNNHVILALIIYFSIIIFIYQKRFDITFPAIYNIGNFTYLFCSLIIGTIFIYLYIHIFKYIYKDWSRVFKASSFTLFPIFLIVFSPLLSAEIYYILNSRGIKNFDTYRIKQYYIFFVFIAFIIAGIYSYYKSVRQKNWKFKPIKFLYNAYAPCLISILMLSNSWTGTSDFNMGEGTEIGNNIIAAQQFHNFNKLPIINTFPPHLMSDIFGPLIYTFIFGYSKEAPFDMLVYFVNGLGWALPAIIFFYYILKKIASAHFAIFFIMLIPNYEEIITSYYGMGFIAILYITSIFFYKSKKNPLTKWMILWLLMVGLFFYRIDLGIGSALTIVSILVMARILGKWKYSIQVTLKSILYSAVIVIILFSLLCFLYDVNPINRIMMIKSIMSLEGQSNAYKNLIYNYAPGFFITYFIIPVALFIFLIIQVKEYILASSKRKEIIILLILFFNIFYFVTFTRALLRHGWFEKNIQFIFSTGYLAFILGSLYYVKANKNLQYFISLTVTYSYFLIHYFCFNNVAPYLDETIIMRGTRAVARIPNLEIENNRIKRINFNTDSINKFDNFKKLLEITLTDDETFLSFNNKDFVYAATNRLMPVYIGQVPMGYSSEKMQKYYLEEVKKVKAPLLIFENNPKSGWDNMDDVPNPVRAYKIAEYFYKNYEPFVLADSLNVWVDKNKKEEYLKKIEPYFSENLNDAKGKAFPVFIKPSEIVQIHLIGKLPYVWGSYDSYNKNKSYAVLETIYKEKFVGTGIHLSPTEEKYFEVKNEFDKGTGNYLFIQAYSKEGGILEFSYSEEPGAPLKDRVFFDIIKSKKLENYLIRISSQWKWMTRPVKSIRVRTDSNINITEMSILKGD